MKKIGLLLLLAGSLVLQGRGQTRPAVDTVRYLFETRHFIQYIRDTFHLTNETVLVDSAFCWLAPGAVTGLDTATIRYMVTHPVFKNWTKATFGPARIIQVHTIRQIFNDLRHDPWKVFHEKYGPRLITLSAPIFFQGYTYCLFAFNVSCGMICGDGYWAVYRKIGNKWIMVKLVKDWVS